jgi:hypothetical protein
MDEDEQQLAAEIWDVVARFERHSSKVVIGLAVTRNSRDGFKVQPYVIPQAIPPPPPKRQRAKTAA